MIPYSDGNIIISHKKMNSDGLYPINQKYQFITILDRNIPYDILKNISHMLHGAGICTPTFARTKSPSHVGKYTSTMEHMGHVSSNSFGD